MISTHSHPADVQLVLYPPVESETRERSTPPDNPLPAEMLQLFEEITGWVIGFEESKSSHASRQLSSSSSAEGTLSIVDMSAAWPARKPTAHRAKCDQLVAHLDALVSDLQATRANLAKTQSLLEAHTPGAVEDDEAELFDCFVPRYVEEELDQDWDDDFELNHELINDDSTRAVDPPFEGWRMGGAPGTVDGRYVDWKLSDDEQIEMFVGYSESHQLVQRGAKLTVDPLTHEFVLSGDEDFNFYRYNQSTGKLSIVERSTGFQRLTSNDLILTSTSKVLKHLIGPDQNLLLTGDVEDSAAQLATLLADEEQLLVLKCD